MMMKISFRNSLLSLFLITTFGLTGCSSTSVTGVWKKSDFTGQPFQSILVIGLSKDKSRKNIWEDIMVDQLKQAGVHAMTSTQCFPGDDDITKEEILRYVGDKGMDSVLVTRLVDTKQEKAYYPPTGGFYGSGFYGGGFYGGGRHGYYNNFGTFYDTVYTPGYTTTYTTVLLETNLYDTASQALVWSMSSDTFDPASANKLAQSVSKKVVQALQKDNLVGKQSSK
jgi:hypothetical protein